MHRNKHVYLSGGMEYADNEGKDWRRELQAWLETYLDCTVFNPNVASDRFLRTYLPEEDFRELKENDSVRFQQLVSQIVDLDCREIAQRADYVVCYWDDAAMRGAGTKGELTIARFFGKAVYMVTSRPARDIPGWVLGCTTHRFHTFDELKSFLTAP